MNNLIWGLTIDMSEIENNKSLRTKGIVRVPFEYYNMEVENNLKG